METIPAERATLRCFVSGFSTSTAASSVAGSASSSGSSASGGFSTGSLIKEAISKARVCYKRQSGTSRHRKRKRRASFKFQKFLIWITYKLPIERPAGYENFVFESL